MILVAGAASPLACEICRRLAAQGERVRFLAPAASGASTLPYLQDLGVETTVGDLREPGCLAAACREAWAVISTGPADGSEQAAGDSIEDTGPEDQLKLMYAARAARAGAFVCVSWPAANVPGSPGALEQHLRENKTGLTCTLLRPSPCMEVWLSPACGFDYVNRRVTVCGTGQDKFSWISLGDLAQFVVASLDNPGAANATFELGGPAALSLPQVVRIFEEVGGRPFEVQYAPQEALSAQRAGVIPSPDRSFAPPMLNCLPAGSVDMRRTLEVFPIKLTSVRDYAARVLGGHR